MATEETPQIPTEETPQIPTEETPQIPTEETTEKEATKTAVEDISSLEQKIIRQVEYYFGNVNLPRDKFLREKITEDEGWITLECLTTFNRLKELSTDLMEIANALKKSKSNVVEIHEDNLKIRRSITNPLPDMGDPMIRKASKMKTLYMKGFPETYSLDNVQDFLSKHDVQTVFVKLRKTDDYKFKGSIFVEAQTQEQADKLLNDKELKCEETVLKVMTRDNYFKVKQDERQKIKDSDEQIKKEHEGESKLPRKVDSVLHFKGTGDQTSREDLKSLFGTQEIIAWVDYSRGETEGFIRYQEEGVAKKALEALLAENEGKILINGTESTVRVIEGDEAENYWKMTEEDMKKKRDSRAGGRVRSRGRSGKGRGGRERREMSKRRRPWEDKKSENTDIVKNEHIRFDDESKAAEAKKVKVEVKNED